MSREVPPPKRHTNVRKRAGGRAVHDMGGHAPLAQPIDREEHDLTLYEKRVDALTQLLSGPKRSAYKIDALRRIVESYAEQEYDGTAYYDRWIRAIRNLCLEQEIITAEELDAHIAAVTKELKAQGRKVATAKVPVP